MYLVDKRISSDPHDRLQSLELRRVAHTCSYSSMAGGLRWLGCAARGAPAGDSAKAARARS